MVISSAGMEPDFDGLPIELERILQDAIVHSRQHHVTIAFCGTVKSGKLLFLNALMGQTMATTVSWSRGFRQSTRDHERSGDRVSDTPMTECQR